MGERSSSTVHRCPLFKIPVVTASRHLSPVLLLQPSRGLFTAATRVAGLIAQGRLVPSCAPELATAANTVISTRGDEGSSAHRGQRFARYRSSSKKHSIDGIIGLDGLERVCAQEQQMST